MGALKLKSEIRISKSETNSNVFKIKKFLNFFLFEHLIFGHLRLFRISCFEIRYYLFSILFIKVAVCFFG